MLNAPYRLSARTTAVAFAQTMVLVIGAQTMDARAEPEGGPAEYAFRWNAAQENGPKTIEAAAEFLAISDEKQSTYQIQYAEVPRPKGLPTSVKVITRQRTVLTGEDGGEVESSYKFRASSLLSQIAPEAKFPCILKSANRESELDVAWGPKPGNTGPHVTPSAGTLAPTEVYSRTCSTKATLEAALPPQTMMSKPLSEKCRAKMTRYKDGPRNLKLEQWRMPNGETLLEVSRKVKKDAAHARLQFQVEIIGRLLERGVIPSQESKTELSKCS
jgi:hypothetical protein